MKIINKGFNEPNHYIIDGKNVIDTIMELVENDCFTDARLIFYKCNIYKYLIRAEKKNRIEDYKKALDYLNRFIERYIIIKASDAHE